MIILQNISYLHPDKNILFSNINLSLASKEKVAIIGNNGVGKSTLLKLIAGNLSPSSGTIITSSKPYYVPQTVGQFNHITIAQAIGVADKINALSQIIKGNTSESNFTTLNDDWTIEERCREALSYWKLDGFDFDTKMSNLSGGEKTKVFLAGIQMHNPQIALLDEPTNHLDGEGRRLLYQFVEKSTCLMVVVSHDRFLLNSLEKICMLSKSGMKVYGGNWDFYVEQKNIEDNALINSLEEKQKSLRKAKETARKAIEQQQKREAQGKKNLQKSNIAPLFVGGRKDSAQNTSARIKGVHTEKINTLKQEITALRKDIPDRDKIKMGIDNSTLHQGKILLAAKGINYAYHTTMLWKKDIDLLIVSGERVAIKGNNGSGKTTLLKLILGDIEPAHGTISKFAAKTMYIDQDYSLLQADSSVYEQAQAFNDLALPEHEIKIRLNRFLFSNSFWDKPCALLSGGERMRLLLCCLTISAQSPDLVVLDEPTNNLDIQNIEILTEAVNNYLGTLLVVSHDLYFLNYIDVHREIVLE